MLEDQQCLIQNIILIPGIFLSHIREKHETIPKSAGVGLDCQLCNVLVCGLAPCWSCLLKRCLDISFICLYSFWFLFLFFEEKSSLDSGCTPYISITGSLCDAQPSYCRHVFAVSCLFFFRHYLHCHLVLFSSITVHSLLKRTSKCTWQED